MFHNLDTALAKRLGVNAALAAQMLWEANEESGWAKTKRFRGKLWIKASSKSLAAVMPYLTPHQTKYAIKRLVKEGIITKVPRMDDDPFDSTNWYAFTTAGRLLMEGTEQDVIMLMGCE